MTLCHVWSLNTWPPSILAQNVLSASKSAASNTTTRRTSSTMPSSPFRGARSRAGFYTGAMPEQQPAFRMGRLDHVHIRVPNRAEAARWYAEHLGFEPVGEYDFWATGFEGGPLQISADGGQTSLALFEVSEGHPMVRQSNGVAFSVDADSFIAFARSLPCGIDSPQGAPLA